MKQEKNIKTDFLIMGSGIAGLRAALELADKGKEVLLITKSGIEDSNTYYAQGGIAAVDPLRVQSGDDSFESHAKDTEKSGDGLCNPAVVQNFAKKAYEEVIDFLIKKGVQFTKNGEKYPYELHQEGGHEHERIYCVGDYTGKAIEEKLADEARANPLIKILENHTAINLVTQNQVSRIKFPKDKCIGAYVLDREKGTVKTIEAKKTILATGGAGRVFQYTSNPKNATGDGIAMAYRAGARVANMEFFQFHPSVLYEPNGNPSERRFLITEALRGQKMGGILTTEKESLEDFVLKYDPRGSHATRDIVAKAIDSEMKKRGLKHVWLNVTPNATGKTESYIKENFPQIYAKCLEKGTDMTKQPIPVIPAAHYTCGGVIVNEFGLTDIDSLYAVGEVSCTGLMGANRLASNALPEGALYGKLAVNHALATISLEESIHYPIPDWKTGFVRTEPDTATLNQFWDTTRSIMMNLCSIDRNEQRLKLAVATTKSLADSANEIYMDFYPTHEIIELRNLTLVANLIAISALERKESRGGHYRSDYPCKDPAYNKPTIISR